MQKPASHSIKKYYYYCRVEWQNDPEVHVSGTVCLCSCSYQSTGSGKLLQNSHKHGKSGFVCPFFFHTEHCGCEEKNCSVETLKDDLPTKQASRTGSNSVHQLKWYNCV